ncbi:MAG: hypothetical protein Q9200_006270 [Gallowayella weberi]
MLRLSCAAEPVRKEPDLASNICVEGSYRSTDNQLAHSLFSFLSLKGDTAPAPLPPSVEAAYKKKCIQLKQRLNDIEAENAAKRIRIDRNKRFVEKMRLEQAILLEHLGKIQQKKGLTPEGLPLYDFPEDDPDSEGSSEGPPTVRIPKTRLLLYKNHGEPDQRQPNEKPLRSKRSHRRPIPSPPPGPGPAHSTPIQEPQHYYTQMDIERNAHLPPDNFMNYEAEFNPANYQPPKVSYSRHLPGKFHDHNPNPHTEFQAWIQHCRTTNPEFANLDEHECLTRAKAAWQRLFSEKEVAKMKAEYEERVDDWYARQEEWEIAEAKDKGTATNNSNPNGAPPHRQATDEDMAGAKGGFTAVNG